MEKPLAILQLEKELGFTANLVKLDSIFISVGKVFEYSLNNERQIIGLKINNFLIKNNRFFDIFKGLTHLTSLNLNSNRLTNIVFLKDLKNLTFLNLADNQLTNIEVLKYLTNVSSLFLYNNQLTNIEVLKYLKNLTALYLFSNRM